MTMWLSLHEISHLQISFYVAIISILIVHVWMLLRDIQRYPIDYYYYSVLLRDIQDILLIIIEI